MTHTESISNRYHAFDQWDVEDMVYALWENQLAAVAAIRTELPSLSLVVKEAAKRLGNGIGRLIYCGAGSAGMIGALDAIELRDTFSWPEQRSVTLMPADSNFTRGLLAEEEDNSNKSVQRIEALNINKNDVFIAISASGASPFTVEALKTARRLGAFAVALCNNPGSPLSQAAHHTICIPTGAEVIAGSTRLGAGSAQKTVLNTFSTALMAHLGFVYDNLMIEVVPNNQKLKSRAIQIIQRISLISEEAAQSALNSYGSIKAAVLAIAGVPAGEIDNFLEANENNLRKTLEIWHNRSKT